MGKCDATSAGGVAGWDRGVCVSSHQRHGTLTGRDSLQYFIKRGETVQGPFGREQLLTFAKAKKITASDLVSNSAEGPFEQLSGVWESITKPTPEPSDSPSPDNETPVSTKTCPYCAEDIKAAAIKCKHCGETLTHQQSEAEPFAKDGTPGLLIRSFNTNGLLDQPANMEGVYADEAVCQLKFNTSGTYILVGGPVLTREDGKTFFIEEECGTNTVSGDAGDSFQAKVDCFHRNWTGVPISVQAFNSQSEIPLCGWHCESRVEYLGMQAGGAASSIAIKAEVRPVLTNDIDPFHGDWVPIDETTQVEWRQGVTKHMIAMVQVGDEYVTLEDPECPLPTVTKIWCTGEGNRLAPGLRSGLLGVVGEGIAKFGGLEGPQFVSEWTVDESHPNVVQVDGEYRMRQLDAVGG